MVTQGWRRGIRPIMLREEEDGSDGMPEVCQGSASGWPGVQPLVALSAGLLLVFLGVTAWPAWTPAAAGARAWTAGLFCPDQAMLEVPTPEFRRGRLFSGDGLCLNPSMPRIRASPASICDCKVKDGLWEWETTRGALRHISGLCLDAPHPDVIGSEVHMWKCLPGLSHQMWDLVEEESMLMNRITGKCVQADNPRSADTRLTMQACLPASRHWNWLEDSEEVAGNWGDMALTSGWSGKIQSVEGLCIKAEQPERNGSALVMGSCDGYDESANWLYAGRTSSLVSSTGLCLDLQEHASYQMVHLWQCFPGLSTQTWGYSTLTGLIATSRSFCVHAAQAGVHGSRVLAAPCSASQSAERWVLRTVH